MSTMPLTDEPSFTERFLSFSPPQDSFASTLVYGGYGLGIGVFFAGVAIIVAAIMLSIGSAAIGLERFPTFIPWMFAVGGCGLGGCLGVFALFGIIHGAYCSIGYCRWRWRNRIIDTTVN